MRGSEHWGREKKRLWAASCNPRPNPGRRALPPLQTRGSAGEAASKQWPPALLQLTPLSACSGLALEELGGTAPAGGFLGLLCTDRGSELHSSTSALRSLERTGSSSASTLVAETIQLLRTLLGVSPLRYRLSSMWERRLHSLRAGWLRCCSCAQG